MCQSIFKHIRNYFLLFFVVLLLAACKRPPATYEAMMTHPDLLGKEITRCEMDNFTGTNCLPVKRAQADFAALVNERSKNPIEFGKKIMTAESHADDLKKESQIISSPVTRKAYEDAEFQVNCLLAVLKSMFDDMH